VTRLLGLLVCMTLSGCANHHLKGYTLRVSAGDTKYETGDRTLNAGTSADFHFEVR